MTSHLTSQLMGYQMLECIGEGAYGAVYRARQEAVDREAAIRDASTGEVLLQFFPDNYSEQTMGIAWTSDGKHVIISGPGIGYLFDASTGEELMQYIGYNDISSIIILSPDDHFVYFMVSDGTARVFEVESGVELLVYEVGGWVNGSLSPDGTRLLLTSTLGEIGIYPTWRTLEELTTYAKVCCVKYELTPEEREQFGLQPK